MLTKTLATAAQTFRSKAQNGGAWGGARGLSAVRKGCLEGWRGRAVRRGDRDRGLPSRVGSEQEATKREVLGRERCPFSFRLPRQVSLLAEAAPLFCLFAPHIGTVVPR